MSHFFRAMMLVLLAGVPRPAYATTYEMQACPPGSVDGTQVFVSAFLDGNCHGRPKVTLYVIDYVARAVCSVRAGKCIGHDEMSDVQREFYDRHEQYRSRVVANPRVCVQVFGEYGTFEMVTGGEALCDPKFNGARSYDPVLKQFCIHLGTRTIGCVGAPLPMR